MKNLLLAGACALALTACGQKAADTTDTNAMTTTSDNMMVPPSDSAMSDNSMMSSDNSALAMAPSTDEFVMKAANSDMYEIASSKLAAANATTPGLKKFANDMIAAHTATTAGLKSAIASGNVSAKPPAAMDAEHQALVDALKAAKGADFDALYKAQQTEAHTKTLALMQGYASSGDNAALKSFASSTAPKVQSHLDMITAM